MKKQMKAMIKQLEEIKKEVLDQAYDCEPFSKEFKKLARINAIINKQIETIKNYEK